MNGLGRLFDFSCGVAPVDLVTAGATGKRVSLRQCQGITAVIYVGAAASGVEAEAFTLKEHTLSSSGTSQTFTGTATYYTKYEATLDGDEVWSAPAAPTAGVITIAAADRDKEGIIAVEIDATALSDGFRYVSIDAADPGSVSRLGAILYVLRDLDTPRKPANLSVPLS
jgi:hypothetical protein